MYIYPPTTRGREASDIIFLCIIICIFQCYIKKYLIFTVQTLLLCQFWKCVVSAWLANMLLTYGLYYHTKWLHADEIILKYLWWVQPEAEKTTKLWPHQSFKLTFLSGISLKIPNVCVHGVEEQHRPQLLSDGKEHKDALPVPCVKVVMGLPGFCLLSRKPCFGSAVIS